MKRTTTVKTEFASTHPTDKLVTLRHSAETWISATDGKATALLGAGGATLALAGFQTTQRTSTFLPYFSGIFFALFCCFGVMSCISAICSL